MKFEFKSGEKVVSWKKILDFHVFGHFFRFLNYFWVPNAENRTSKPSKHSDTLRKVSKIGVWILNFRKSWILTEKNESAQKLPEFFPNIVFVTFLVLKRRFDTAEQVRKLPAVRNSTKKRFFQLTTFSTYDLWVYLLNFFQKYRIEESVHNLLNALYEKSIGRHFSARFSGFADHDRYWWGSVWLKPERI